MEEKLTKQVSPGLFELTAFNRKGSAPLPAGESGASRLVVYYSADLRFKQDMDFAGWDKMSPKSLAFALGATEKGLFGVKQQNKSGDPLHVYGTSTYEWTNDAWKSTAPATTGVSPAPDIDNTAPPSRSKQLIDKLAAMVNVGPAGLDPQQDAIISDELDRATGAISRRLERRKQVYTVASGPGGGEYARFGSAFVETVKKARPELGVRHAQTQGSVENARLLARGGADYAIVQGDVAAQALAGQGPFAQGGPLTSLRALGSLFPEAVHLVVLPDSPIKAVDDLRGKRVDIGAPQSGTRGSALAVLAAHGVRRGRSPRGERGAARARRAAPDRRPARRPLRHDRPARPEPARAGGKEGAAAGAARPRRGDAPRRRARRPRGDDDPGQYLSRAGRAGRDRGHRGAPRHHRGLAGRRGGEDRGRHLRRRSICAAGSAEAVKVSKATALRGSRSPCTRGRAGC